MTQRGNQFGPVAIDYEYYIQSNNTVKIMWPEEFSN